MTALSDFALHDRTGRTMPLAVDHWHGMCTDEERHLIASTSGPLLDVGCGPGRVVEAAAGVGRVALGIDPSPEAVARARERGVAVLQRSVFDPVPGQGRWGCVALLDGNIGIGGDPARLLARVSELMGPGACALVEVAPQPGSWSGPVRLVGPDGPGPWFPWAVTDLATLVPAASTARLFVQSTARFTGVTGPRVVARLVSVAPHGGRSGP